MNTVGIIAEYNPFHNGHLFHLKKAKELTDSEYTVVVMSGNYVQRGEPSICDKYIRTKMALLHGADLVIELPVYYAAASAAFFSQAAVSILDRSGIVNTLCFGSEAGDITDISKIAKKLAHDNSELDAAIKHELNYGVSYPTARATALCESECRYRAIIETPNNILAIEYLRALIKLNSSIQPVTVKREGADYHSPLVTGVIASATAIRHAALASDFESILRVMPQDAYGLFSGEQFCTLNDFSQIFQYIIKTTPVEAITQISEITEGLENRIFHFAGKHFDLYHIIPEIKTKRYTYTKIQRTILNIILNITKEAFDLYEDNGGPQYVRVLGFRKESEKLLHELSKKSQLPIVTNLKHSKKLLNPLAFSMLEKEVESTDLYYIARGNAMMKCTEYSKPVVII